MKHKYKNKIIENIKYMSENRWFILEINGNQVKDKRGNKIFLCNTLKEAK